MPAAAAYCDVDGTLAATTIVTPLLWYRRRRNAFSDKLWLASLPLRAPWWLLLDRVSRGASNRSIYRSYAGFDAAGTRAGAQECVQACLWPRLFPQALDRLATLKKKGVKIVLITGSLDFIMRPLADFLGAELIAPDLLERNGTFTGRMDRPPLTGTAKYVALARHATRHKIDLSASFAFGDAHGDLNMLYAVGHPVAVNPDRRLEKTARARGWEVVLWKN